MQTYQHRTYFPLTDTHVPAKKSLLSRFLNWAEGQEEFRFGWLAVILAFHGCVLTPLTLFAVYLAGSNMVFFSIVMGAMAACLISNLSAMPTRITIPVFFFSVAIDIVMVGLCIAA
jgi:hypothetical protein